MRSCQKRNCDTVLALLLLRTSQCDVDALSSGKDARASGLSTFVPLCFAPVPLGEQQEMSAFYPTPSEVDIDRDPGDPRPELVSVRGKNYRRKKANLPFLKSHRWPPSSNVSDNDDVVRQQGKKATMDRKEGSPPLERASDVSRSILRYSALLVLGTLLLSRMMTQSWDWGYNVNWNLARYLPRPASLL